MLTPLTLALALNVVPDGTLLTGDRACYTIFAATKTGEQPIGETLQTIDLVPENGQQQWRITVHQRLDNGTFDMRDAFVLDRKTLQPLSLRSERNHQPHADLMYANGRVSGSYRDRLGVKHLIDQALKEPVWEGNLFGPNFAALPLAAGANFTLPYFQYTQGFGVFTISVKGTETVTTPAGAVEAWVLDAGPNASQRLEYLIEKDNRRELGYRSSDGGQRLGGDCTGLD